MNTCMPYGGLSEAGGQRHKEDMFCVKAMLLWCHSCCRLTCVGQINDRKEDHPSSQRYSKEKKSLELLLCQPVLEILQESIGLQQCKHTCKDKHTHMGQ